MGALAGVFSRAFTTPLSNVTVRKQTHSSSRSEPWKSGDEKQPSKSTDRVDSSDDEETTYEDEPTLRRVINEIVQDRGIIGARAMSSVRVGLRRLEGRANF